VDFELSDDQVALGDAASDLLSSLASPERVRSALASDGGYDRRLWEAMAEQGWMAIERPEEKGGLGLGMVEVAVLCERLGRHGAPVPFVTSQLALGALVGASDQAPDASWATGLASGELVGCVAWSRRNDAVVACRADSGWVLDGRPDPVVSGPDSDLAVVQAVTRGDGAGGDRLSLFALELAGGLRPDVQPAMDRTRSIGWLDLRRQPAVRLGGEELVDGLLDQAAVMASAALLGGADHVLQMTVDYAKERVQFGRPIGSFQAVKHRCADMLVDVEGMRSTAYNAAWSVGIRSADAHLAASTAKAWCADAAHRVMASGLQVHGGIGFTWEHDLHIFLKRAQLDERSFGDAAFHRERLARLLRSRVEAGEPVL
jgi:alkylation response protein AidB-like acyl-CoA dehydrogenase